MNFEKEIQRLKEEAQLMAGKHTSNLEILAKREGFLSWQKLIYALRGLNNG